jgi:BarA-like signal transduction histidine kinase
MRSERLWWCLPALVIAADPHVFTVHMHDGKNAQIAFANTDPPTDVSEHLADSLYLPHFLICSFSCMLQAVQKFCTNNGIADSICEEAIMPQLLPMIQEQERQSQQQKTLQQVSTASSTSRTR